MYICLQVRLILFFFVCITTECVTKVYLSGLPAPKASTQNNKISDDLLEDEVKPKASQIADAPKPPVKKRQPVKISIPTIDSVSNA